MFLQASVYLQGRSAFPQCHGAGRPSLGRPPAPYRQTPPLPIPQQAGGTHPNGMHSCFL